MSSGRAYGIETHRFRTWAWSAGPTSVARSRPNTRSIPKGTDCGARPTPGRIPDNKARDERTPGIARLECNDIEKCLLKAAVGSGGAVLGASRRPCRPLDDPPGFPG